MGNNLANKYRPKKWEDVVGQEYITQILSNQLKNNDFRNAYLFVGGAGTGKTTCARIFANEINKGEGDAIEIDGASNNGVDEVRNISEQARVGSMIGKYKVFIIDECHMITTQGWNAMLKLLEEPPTNTIFILCTTNPEKIPKTIMSRVQRYDFNRISNKDITIQLAHILTEENISSVDPAVLEYIAKISDGHLRDAINALEKCLSFKSENEVLNYELVTKALGLPFHGELKELLVAVINSEDDNIIKWINEIYMEGNDLKRVVKDELAFTMDCMKYRITNSMEYCKCPDFCEQWFREEINASTDVLIHIINTLLETSNLIKFDESPRTTVEAMMLLESDFIRLHKEVK